MSDNKDWINELGYEEQEMITAGKRCGLVWTPWMGDFFTSYSPRNHNSNAEGPWDHWVDLALKILGDPMTKIVRPEAYIENPPVQNFYAETHRDLTADELAERFRSPTTEEDTNG